MQSDYARVSEYGGALFVASFERSSSGLTRCEKRISKKRGWRSSFRGQNRQPALPRGVVLMASIRLSGMCGGRNLYSPLPGALVPSPSQGGGIRAPFFFGRGVAGMADHTRQHAWMAPFFSRSVFHDVPVYPCFLEREVWGLRPSCWVAESRRHGDRSRRSWHPKNQRILSVIVMLVTGTGDKVVYRLGRGKGRARSPTACGGPTRGRRGDRSPPLGAHFDFFGRR